MIDKRLRDPLFEVQYHLRIARKPSRTDAQPGDSPSFIQIQLADMDDHFRPGQPRHSDGVGHRLLARLVKLQGMLFMLFSIACLSVCLMITKLIYTLDGTMTPLGIFTLSAVAQIPLNETFRLMAGERFAPLIRDKKKLGLVVLRQSTSIPGWLAFNFSARHLPIGFVQLFQNSTPIVSVIIARAMLREKPENHDVLFTLVAFAGVMIASIGMFLKAETGYRAGVIEISACVFTVFSFATVNVISRALKGIHVSVLGSAQQIANAAIAIPLWVAFEDPISTLLSLDAKLFGTIMCLALARFTSTMCFIHASQIETVARVAFVNYFQSPLGYVFDMVVFGYTLSLAEWASVALVGLAGGLMVRKVLE